MRAVRKIGKAVRAKFVQAEEQQEEDEFKEGMQEVADMRVRYEGLLEVAKAAAERAYQFASAQKEYALYVQDTFGAIDSDEIGECYQRVGKVQLEVAKYLDAYSMHLAQTIKAPTEDMLSELQKVEDSKRAYDDHRLSYEQHKQRVAKQRGRSRELVNGEDASHDKQLKLVKDEFDEVTMQLGCELLSLEQKRPKALIAQAVRHHAAQMRLFSAGLQSLHSVDPYLKSLMHAKNISTRFEDSEDEEEDDDLVSAGSVEHPEAIYDWDNQSEASPVSTPRSSTGVELTELPAQLPPEWNSLLNSLNDTLEQMGEETLDTKDALFTMNAMLMAANEQSSKSQQDEAHSTLSGHMPHSNSGSRSAPLSSTGIPLFMLGGPIPIGEVAPGDYSTPSSSTARGPTTSAGPGSTLSTPPTTSSKVPHSGALTSFNKAMALGTRSGPLTASGVPLSLAANGGVKAGGAKSGQIPGTRPKRIANSGPILPSAATRSGPLLVGNPAMAKATASISPVQAASTGTPRSSMYSSRSGPIVLMAQDRIPRSSNSAPIIGGAPQAADEGPHPLPTEASTGPPKPADSISRTPSLKPPGRSPLGHPRSLTSPSTSPMTSPPISPPHDSELYKLPPPPLSHSTSPLTPASAPVPTPLPPQRGHVRVASMPGRKGEGYNEQLVSIAKQHTRHASVPISLPSSEAPPSDPPASGPSPPKTPFSAESQSSTVLTSLMPKRSHSPPEHLRRSLSFGQEKRLTPEEAIERVPLPLPEEDTVTAPHMVRRLSGGSMPGGSGPAMEPFMTLSSPLPAMPPPTPPERPELQGALSSIGTEEREHLVQTVGANEFKWRWLDGPQGGLRQAPEWTSVAKDQQEALLQVLARAVVSRREGFREHMGFADGDMDFSEGSPEVLARG